jgi:hypothetical protein
MTAVAFAVAMSGAGHTLLRSARSRRRVIRPSAIHTP